MNQDEAVLDRDNHEWGTWQSFINYLIGRRERFSYWKVTPYCIMDRRHVTHKETLDKRRCRCYDCFAPQMNIKFIDQYHERIDEAVQHVCLKKFREYPDGLIQYQLIQEKPITDINMKTEETELSGVKILTPGIFEDERGFFFESYNRKALDAAGIIAHFVQDNHSLSIKNVLRGLHYQIVHPQGKLVRCVSGEIFDVAVDIRPDSMTFGKWFGVNLSAQNKKMLWIPPGLAHGFYVLSETADVLYKTTAGYYPEYDRCIRWDDPDLGITWPIQGDPIVSKKDQEGKYWKDLQTGIDSQKK